MERPDSSERLTWLVCCTVGAIVGLSAASLALLQPAEHTRPLIRSMLAFVALSVGCVTDL